MSACWCCNSSSGIPFLSVKMCLFVPNLLLSTGIIASHLVQSPKEDFIHMLSMDCQIHLIPLLWPYSFNNLIHNFLKMPNWTHSWNRLWQIEADLYSEGSSISHWQPVLRTYNTIHYFSKRDYRTIFCIIWFFCW